MKVVIAGDHYAVELMNKIQRILKSKRITAENVGTDSENVKVSLQEIIPKVTNSVRNSEADFGILACGTGVWV